MRCAECERYICPKDMVETPVGYKCPVCAKQPRSATVQVKPRQLAGAAGMGLVVGAGGGLLLGLLGFGFFFVGLLWGGATAEAVRRGSGGHLGWTVASVAIVSLLAGWLLGNALGRVSVLTLGMAVLAAVGMLAWGWRR